MRDVAALAGVSLKTVSRVVNKEPGVSEDLREKVAKAAQRLDYRHNLAASNLRRADGRTGVIGALVQDLSNSFSAGLLRSLEDDARQRRYVVLAASIDEEPDRERSLVADLASRRVDGLVIMSATSDHTYLASELRAGLPTVFVDRPPQGVDADYVIVDNYRSSRLAVKHLLAGGHRRIAMLSDLLSIPTAQDRVRGYTAALKSQGIAFDPTLVVGELRTDHDAEEATLDLLAVRHPPTAIYASRNILSVGAVRALQRVGRSHEVAVVGFDDFPMAELLDPPLTVVRQDVRRIGAEAAALLFARINGDTSARREIVLKGELVQRGSGEIPAPGPGGSTSRDSGV